MSSIPWVTIHPNEANVGLTSRYVTEKIPTGYTIDSGVVAAVDLESGEDTTSDVVDDTTATVTAADANGTQLATALVKGNGSFTKSKHKVTMTLTLSGTGDDKTFVDVFVVVVDDQVEDC